MTYTVVLKDGHFDPDAGQTAETLAETMRSVVAEQPSRIVIHLHGGLISRESGQTAADRLEPLYRQAGAVPMFLVWESGWQEIIGQRLEALGQDTLFLRIRLRVAQFVQGKMSKELGPPNSRGVGDKLQLLKLSEIEEAVKRFDEGGHMFPNLDAHELAPGAVTAPDAGGLDPAEHQQILQEIQADPVLNAAAQEQSATAPRNAALMDQTAVEGGERGLISTLLLAKRIAAIVARVVWRFSQRRDHGFYLTISEEILREFYVAGVGKFLWDGMKSAVADAFTPDGGGTALIASLSDMWNAGLHPAITLVGHSAGAIYAARLLKELHAAMPPEWRVNLVLIAPACTFTVLADAIQQAGSRVAGLRIFGMSDDIERQDALAGPVYPASLLYLVSGVLEETADEPLVGMQRFYDAPYAADAFPGIAGVTAFEFLKRNHAFAWSIADGFEGGNCDMRSHGGWVSAEQTRLSVMSVIQHGYGDA